MFRGGECRLSFYLLISLLLLSSLSLPGGVKAAYAGPSQYVLVPSCSGADITSYLSIITYYKYYKDEYSDEYTNP